MSWLYNSKFTFISSVSLVSLITFYNPNSHSSIVFYSLPLGTCSWVLCFQRFYFFQGTSINFNFSFFTQDLYSQGPQKQLIWYELKFLHILGSPFRTTNATTKLLSCLFSTQHHPLAIFWPETWHHLWILFFSPPAEVQPNSFSVWTETISFAFI